jgi:ketosteroid isomerase-like protein
MVGSHLATRKIAPDTTVSRRMSRFARVQALSERDAETVHTLYRAWNWGQVGTLLDLLHPQIEWSDWEEPSRRLHAVERDVRTLLGVLDVSYHLQSLTWVEGGVVAEGIATGTGGTYSRFPQPFTHLLEIRDGLVSRRRAFASPEEALAAAPSAG